MSVGGAEARRVFQSATSGRNVELVGPRLSGRSHVLRLVEQEYRRAGYTVVVVRGAGDQLPLAALRLALSDAAELTRPGAPAPARIAGILAERRPAAVLVDDADRLDQPSWEAVALAHRTAGFPIVAAVGRGTSVHDPRALGQLAPPVRVALEPLSLDDVQDVLVHLLDGDVAPTLASRLHTKSGGRIGLVTALAGAAVAEGRIRRREETWTDLPDLWSDALAPVYDALLADADEPLAEAVEMLALAGVIELDTALRLVGEERAERLERASLLRVFMVRSRAMAAVEPPGLTDYFLHRPHSARRSRLLTAIEALSAAQRDSRSAPVPSRALPEPVAGTTELPQLAHMFRDAFAGASSAAASEWRQARSVSAAVRVLSLQLTGPVDHQLVEEILSGTLLDGAAEEDALAFRFLASRWRLTTGEGPEAAIDTLREGVSPDAVFSPAVEALTICLRMETSAVAPDAVVALERLATGEDPNAAVARLVLAFASIVSGRGREALAHLDAMPAPVRGTILAAQHEYAYGLALYAAGRLEQAAEWAGSHLQRCLAEADRDGLVGHAYVAVLARAALGQFDEAFSTAQLVLSTGATAGQLLFAPDRAVFVVLAFVAIRTGRGPAARSLAGRAADLPGRSDALPFGSTSMVEAARRSAEGAGEEAAAAYRELADAVRDRGYLLAAETLELLAVLAHFDVEAAASLSTAGGAASSDLYRAWITGLTAQAAGDADGLVEAGRDLGALGARDQAMKLLGQAARLYRARGDDAGAERAQGELRLLLDESVHTAGGAIDDLGLSEREADIIREIAAGRSNVEIAGRLGVSVRTVDSHLRNIRQKTGAVDRDDLARIAGRSAPAATEHPVP